jgi:hypothetical protein
VNSTDSRESAAYDSEDGIDEDVWSRLVGIVSAAFGSDAASYTASILRWADDFPVAGQRRMGAYLMYLLGYRVKELLRQNKPSDDDLRAVARAAHSDVLQILDKVTAEQLEATVLIAFDRPTLDAGISPAEFIVFAGATLGILLDDPSSDLPYMRPRLANWWKRHHENFRAQGLFD